MEDLAIPSTYEQFLDEVSGLLELARRRAVRSIDSIIVETYWQVGRRIVQVEQGGVERAAYGARLLERLSTDLTGRLGRGFSARNLRLMRQFFLTYPEGKAIWQTPSAKSEGGLILPLTWSHYTLLMGRTPEARAFYHAEALRGGWTAADLERQINSQFYERLQLSRDKAAMLEKAPKGVEPTAEQEIRNPIILEFLDLKDEYSESDLEEALILKLEEFLLELGSDFAFVGRQKRLRIGDDWYRVDLLMFHRKLRCLVLIDLKLGKLTHADAGQMHTYLNYARKHWTNEGENPPVGLILCSDRNQALAQYALEGLPNQVLATEYRLQLPNPEVLERVLERTRLALQAGQDSTEE